MRLHLGSRHRAILAIGGSLVLHAAVLSASWLLPGRDSTRSAQRPVSITIATRARPSVAPSAEAAARPHGPVARSQRAGAVRPSAIPPAPAASAPVAGPPVGSTPPGAIALAPGPRRIELVPEFPLDTGVAPGPERGREVDGELRARAAIEEPWRERARDVAAERELELGRARTTALERRFGSEFSPAAAALVGRARAGLRAPAVPFDPTHPETLTAPNQGTDVERLVSALNGIPRNPAPEYHPPPDAAKGLPAAPYAITVSTSKLLAELAALVEVEHDEDGEPEAWHLVQSSGDRDFDQAALRAVESGVADARPVELRVRPQPLWTRWRFSAQLYWWQRDMDPSFTPPGTPVESGILGTTTLVREARLVALKFRVEEPPAGATPPRVGDGAAEPGHGPD